jgi:DNA invertase Pin-like site-specific DNA recombinase
MTIIAQLKRAAETKQRIPELIRQARQEGKPWDEIAKALNMSRAGVIKLSKNQTE